MNLLFKSAINKISASGKRGKWNPVQSSINRKKVSQFKQFKWLYTSPISHADTMDELIKLNLHLKMTTYKYFKINCFNGKKMSIIIHSVEDTSLKMKSQMAATIIYGLITIYSSITFSWAALMK